MTVDHLNSLEVIIILIFIYILVHFRKQSYYIVYTHLSKTMQIRRGSNLAWSHSGVKGIVLFCIASGNTDPEECSDLTNSLNS